MNTDAPVLKPVLRSPFTLDVLISMGYRLTPGDIVFLMDSKPSDERRRTRVVVEPPTRESSTMILHDLEEHFSKAHPTKIEANTEDYYQYRYAQIIDLNRIA